MLLDDYEERLIEAMRKSNRGLDFVNHGFTIWENESGELETSPIVSGDDVYLEIPRKPRADNVIYVFTRCRENYRFDPLDLTQVSPFSDEFQGSTKAVCLLVDYNDQAALRCIQRTPMGKRADNSEVIEVTGMNERIEQSYYNDEISEDEARSLILENLEDYTRITENTLSIGSFKVSI